MAQPPLHDSLFREGFSLSLVARQFLTRWLAPEFLELVDWSSLEIQKISGINTALAERHEDIVYRVRAGGAPVWFYLLHHSELKSPEIRQIVASTIPDNVRESFMSTAEMLRQEGRQEGVILARQKAVLDALEIRFADVPDGLRETIDTIHDEPRLRSLHQAAIQAASLEDFARAL